MLRDGWYMSPNDAQEELEEVQSDLKKREDEVMIDQFRIDHCTEPLFRMPTIDDCLSCIPSL